MTRFTLVLAVLLLASTTSIASGDLMKEKTEHAERMFRNLALGDLATVKEEADKLEKLTIKADFAAMGKEYEEYATEFLKIVRALKQEAGRNNLAGSYYQFTRMTGVCFACHDQLRDKRKQ